MSRRNWASCTLHNVNGIPTFTAVPQIVGFKLDEVHWQDDSGEVIDSGIMKVRIASAPDATVVDIWFCIKPDRNGQLIVISYIDKLGPKNKKPRSNTSILNQSILEYYKYEIDSRVAQLESTQ